MRARFYAHLPVHVSRARRDVCVSRRAIPSQLSTPRAVPAWFHALIKMPISRGFPMTSDCLRRRSLAHLQCPRPRASLSLSDEQPRKREHKPESSSRDGLTVLAFESVRSDLDPRVARRAAQSRRGQGTARRGGTSGTVGADAAGAEVKLLRRHRRPAPEPVDHEAAREEWADLLRRYRTRSSPEMQRELYHAETRQRQKARAGANTPPRPETSQSRLLDTHADEAQRTRAETVSGLAPPQTSVKTVLTDSEAPPKPEPVPSVAPAEGPAPKTPDEWAYEHFLAFEKLCGNADRIAERLEEARAYEPEEAPPEYLW